MKKLIAAAAAVAMMFAMSATAFAEVQVSDKNLSVNSQGTVMDTAEQEATLADLQGAVAEDANLKAELDKAGIDLTKGEDILGGVQLEGGNGTITIAFGEAVDGSREVYGIHQMENGKWEVVKGVALTDGNYSFTFDGNSPVIFALGNAIEGKGDVETTDPNAAPKTGDNGAVAVVVAAANAIA